MSDYLREIEQKARDPERLSVQGRADNKENNFGAQSDVMGGAGVLWMTINARIEQEPRWNALYPNFRDRFLDDFSRSESMAASAVYSMKTRIGTLNYEVNGPPRAKKFAQELLNKPGLGDTLPMIVQKVSGDLDTADNGAFIELWRAGSPDRPPPKGSPVVGFAHLDSRLCWRSFDLEFPVWYTNPITGQIRKLHKDRVIFAADNPQSVEMARGIGFCAISRALRMIRVFKNMQIFVDEKVSGRFTRALGAISGVSAGQVKRALENHDREADNKGYVVYNDIPFLIDPSTEGRNDIKILLQDLASIPDGFSFKDDADLYAYILAFCFGVDAREFWPATQSGATKADATVQNMKARGRGIGNRIQTVETMLRAALPDSVTFEYDFTDDDQDMMQADIQGKKIHILSTALRDGAIEPIEYRALAIAQGILDGALLETMELPMNADSANDSEDEAAGIQPNTQNSADPGDGNAVTEAKALALKTESAYRRSLRQAVRGLWTGDLGEWDFLDTMEYILERNLTKAWHDGMKLWGLSPADMTDAEKERLKLEINTQIMYIGGLADSINFNSKANGGKLAPLYDRLEMWVKQYGRIMSLAGTMAAADQKGLWKYGDTANHCVSCSSYAGKVYRNSVWTKWLEPLDMMPRGKGLACGGWQCDCSIVKTSESVTPGRPAIVKAHIHAPVKIDSHHTETLADDKGIHASNGNGSGRNGQSDPARYAVNGAHVGA